jgi:hypothetical protein
MFEPCEVYLNFEIILYNQIIIKKIVEYRNCVCVCVL